MAYAACGSAVGTDRPPCRQGTRSRSQYTANMLRKEVRRGAAIVRPVDGKYDETLCRWFHQSKPMNRPCAHNMERRRPARTIPVCPQERGHMQTRLYSWNVETYPKKLGEARTRFTSYLMNVTAHRSKRSFQVEDFTFVAGHLLL